MNGPIKRHLSLATAAAALLGFTFSAGAQVPVDENGDPVGTYQQQGTAKPANTDDTTGLLSATELEDLVGPVALYPDDLLAIVLPASTYPLEIVQAARFLKMLESDSSLEPDEQWDDSIVALLNYPDVVGMMDEDIDWTWRLGEAVINQQNDVIAAVESFRDRAYAAGNLKSDEHQNVDYDDEGVLEIVPVSEEIIYVPYYEPAEVVVRQPRRVYYYYPDPYPVYYYPYPTGYRFRSGHFWGVTTAFSIGWSNHYLHVYHPSYWGHPYYGSHYYNHYYRRPSITIFNNWYVNNNYRTHRHRYRDGDYWRPRARSGAQQRVRNYHYSPNGSRNSRDFTVRRENRLRVGNDGRMDLGLRERDSRTMPVAGTRNTRSHRGLTGNSSTRNTSVASHNRTRSTATSPDATNSRTSATSSRNDLSLRDRSSDRRNRTRTNRLDNGIATGRRTGMTRRDTTDRFAAPPRVNASSSRPRQSNGTSTTRRSIAVPPRAGAPQNRRTVTSARTAAPTRRTAPAPRVSTPRATPAPRSSAPVTRPRSTPAPRSSSRSSSRSNSPGSNRRPRVRTHQD